MQKPSLALVGTLTALAALAEPNLAAAPAPALTPYFAANCANCHGTDGKAASAIPPLAGRDRAYLEQSMQAFKTGARPATIMHQLAKGYTDEEIAVLAEYFAKQK
ncbi:MAG: c-type cytochrome [Candidatus Accumulibacter phosphatis]|uniref:c-type cytochrome n=1 Tax=Candidatus Accumulibacter phosphatis TaxID=327160 RepID=UPI001A4715D9|nr:c-type cytochrome [Candidatus Accumulibacter phosphatis]